MLWIVATLEGRLNSVKGRRSPYKIKEHDQLTMKDTFWVWCRRILGTSQLVMMFCGIGWSMTSPIQIFEFIFIFGMVAMGWILWYHRKEVTVPYQEYSVALGLGLRWKKQQRTLDSCAQAAVFCVLILFESQSTKKRLSYFAHESQSTKFKRPS